MPATLQGGLKAILNGKQCLVIRQARKNRSIVKGLGAQKNRCTRGRAPGVKVHKVHPHRGLIIKNHASSAPSSHLGSVCINHGHRPTGAYQARRCGDSNAACAEDVCRGSQGWQITTLPSRSRHDTIHHMPEPRMPKPRPVPAPVAAPLPAAPLHGCRVCGRRTLRTLAVIDAQTYWRCGTCQATLLADAHLPTRVAEHARYAQHNNDPNDKAYRAFLQRLSDPLLKRLPAAQEGLDYGCGPGPALAQILGDAGHTMQIYDPIFFPDTDPLERDYDFITCTEVVEHFHHPRAEFQQLDRLLRPGGTLAIMTNFQTDDEQFANWHYRRDPTHVTFYREATFRSIAQDLEWICHIPARNIVIMQKQW